MAAVCFKKTINSSRYPVPQEYEAVPQRHCYPHNYLDDASVDSNSGTIILLRAKSQDVLELYYASREACWTRASTCVQGHERRHRKGDPEVLRQETTQIGMKICFCLNRIVYK